MPGYGIKKVTEKSTYYHLTGDNMPLYDYKCSVCSHEFDKIVTRYDTEAKEPCPKCGGESSTFMPQGSRSGVKFLFDYLAPDA